ncbi:hypothetical protein RchiOBHm_Chr3g0465261 [Rosa chinensis]|uniref:Uncharacterized protein n=1 Tax=Rosa chinensis TaxID=74649 RepID=A0A2P6R9N6_ROSCH|nr:hypothetical protein RchiOBHm_Chr3g0465261 [Rosa chinensis]
MQSGYLAQPNTNAAQAAQRLRRNPPICSSKFYTSSSKFPDAFSLEDCVPPIFLNYDISSFGGCQWQYEA